MKKHFVTFLSPGTFVSEQSTKPISSWDVAKAKKMAHSITERYNATPYGFYFSTRERKASDLDSKETKRSGIHYLGGKILTAKQVLAGKDPKEKILRSNVEINKIKRIIVNDNSWRFTAEFRDDDVLLDWR